MEGSKILIIDDHIDNIKLIVSVFQEHLPEFKTFQTNNPLNALGIAKKVQPDLILTDWNMPGMSGLELIQSLRNEGITKEIPIIMVTGTMISTRHLQMALNAGAIDYVRSPIDHVELIARTKAALLITSYYREIVQQKDRELTESSLHMVKSHEYMGGFSSKLDLVDDLIDNDPITAKIHLKQLRREIQQESERESWNRFHLSFSNVHTDFVKNLVGCFPSLTPAETKLSCLIKLGMANKEMATVLHQAPDSIKVSRYRLRKKMGLKSGTNMETFLTRF